MCCSCVYVLVCVLVCIVPVMRCLFVYPHDTSLVSSFVSSLVGVRCLCAVLLICSHECVIVGLCVRVRAWLWVYSYVCMTVCVCG